MARPVIVADRDIPFLEDALAPYASLVRLPASQIDAGAVKGADALIVRTRTRCDASLLEGSSVSFVASATIGTDHIDMEYCRRRGIAVASAPGCNADAVRQYVVTAIFALAARAGLSLAGRTLGVVGVGNVGSRVADIARKLGGNVLCNDPPRQMREEGFVSSPLEHLLESSDIVTLHIPLEGNRRFADSRFFSMMRPGAIFINASRGEVVDEDSLLAARGKLGGLILDVWCGEPRINPVLLDACDIATPHIAGYSMQGKINATVAVVRAFGGHFGISQLRDFALPGASAPLLVEGIPLEKLPAPLAPSSGDVSEADMAPMMPVPPLQERIAKEILGRYDIWADDAALRAAPASFEALRSGYKYRTEF